MGFVMERSSNEYGHLFSDDVRSFLPSPVRAIFRNVDMAEVISFAGGYPSPETFPMESIKSLMAEVLDKYGPKTLQYGATEGVPELRRAIACRYGVGYDNVRIVTSSQQGIDVCARVMVDPGDVVLAFMPSFLGALQSFRSYRADIRGVKYSDDPETIGRNLDDAVQAAVHDGRKVKFLYCIPDFQNPSGITVPLDVRKAVLESARRNGFIVVEDSPYRELRYEGEEVPSMYSLDPDNVIHLGSFSKIFAPGFRIGWIFAPVPVLDQIVYCKQSLDLCAPVFNQYLAAEYMSGGLLDSGLAKTIDLYRKKRDCMLEMLEKHMPEGVEWTRPSGGLFIFLRLPAGMDAEKMCAAALESGVAYVAGKYFYTDGEGADTLRLNFSFADMHSIREGIRRLSLVIKQNM